MSGDPRLFSKTAAETKAVVYDLAGALNIGDGEKVDDPAPSAVTVAPVGLTVSTPTKNASELARPGKRTIAAAEALQCFLSGGTAGTVYTVTFPYTTTGGQTLAATLKVKVV